MKISSPSLPASLNKPNDPMDLFSTEDSISGVHVENTWLTTNELEKTNVSESRFTKVDFSSVTVPRFDIVDCEFQKCNFTASKFPDSGWRRISIEGTRCSGLSITNGVIKDASFKNSKLEIANFRFTHIENAIFEDCAIDDIDFYNARLKNIEFINCTINKISFANARITNVDISKSIVEGIVGINSLKGVTISYEQLLQLAPVFAAEAGIKIK